MYNFCQSFFLFVAARELYGVIKVTFMFTSVDIKTDRKFVQTALMLYQNRHKTALQAAWFTNAIQYQIHKIILLCTATLINLGSHLLLLNRSEFPLHPSALIFILIGCAAGRLKDTNGQPDVLDNIE